MPTQLSSPSRDPVAALRSPRAGNKKNATSAPATAPERNVREVILTNLRVETWFPSFYPEELVGRAVDRLLVCKWCFKYSTKVVPFVEHSKCCSVREAGPTGTLIYEKGNVSIYELDGDDHPMFTQNLSLFAKLFLDTKSVFFDVTTFLYYVLYFKDPTVKKAELQPVGFFSKEKLSWDSNNLACICVFPPWQKRGFGQILMGVSYELSKWDGRLGGPEKPLSELGRRAYMNYWAATIARFVANLPPKETVTVKSISAGTYILPEDIVASLKAMDVVERRKIGDAEAVINRAKVRTWMAQNRIDMAGPVDANSFVNEPTMLENGE